MIERPQGVYPPAAPLARRRLSSRRLYKRYRREWYFKACGLAAVCVSIAILFALLGGIGVKGYTAFKQTYILMNITLSETDVKKLSADPPKRISTRKLIALSFKQMFSDVTERNDQSELMKLLGVGVAHDLKEAIAKEKLPIEGEHSFVFAALASDDVDQYAKGLTEHKRGNDREDLSDAQIKWLATLQNSGVVEQRFNLFFLTGGDSREPERAGILGALVGSFLTLSITLVLSFILGVGAAVYLEEIAYKNRLTDIVEVNINNLAAVPSIVFGLLGMAVFIGFLGIPRSTPLVGGLTLSLMTLPTVVIVSRAALKSVPQAVRDAALGLGASRLQTILHHVLPFSLPGMLTGTIIGMARALGETAPLLMIGMVAFIADIPSGFLDPATALPVQVYLWADSPEGAFLERTCAAIMILLGFLIAMNLGAIILRKKSERKW